MKKALFISIVFALFFPTFSSAQQIEWTRQFGTFDTDSARGISLDPSGIYVVGATSGTFFGLTPAGESDAFIRKYDTDGKEVWTEQFGTWSNDFAQAAATDSSGIYVVGATNGAFPDQTSAGDSDAFIRKYDADGKEVWTRQFGTWSDDFAQAVATDPSGIYVVGATHGAFPGQVSAGVADAFIRKYDADGTELWAKQFGTPDTELVQAVSADPSGIYVVGYTFGTFLGQTSAGGADAFLRKYDTDGNEIWTRQFGTSGTDLVRAVFADPTGIYVAGYTFGAFPGQLSAGDFDTFVRKYDSAGNEIWTRQFGTSGADYAQAISAGPFGIYVAGATSGTFPGQHSAGGSDVFIRKYDPNGYEYWTRQLGSSGWDSANDVLADSSGIYLIGQTYGAFFGQMPAGGADAFITKIKGVDAATTKTRKRANQPPVIKSAPDLTWYLGSTNSFTISAKDPEGYPLTYQITGNLPPGISLEPGGIISGTPTTVGTYPVSVKVSDSQGEAASANLTMMVKVTIEGLIWEVRELNLAGEVTRRLLSPLEAARAARSQLNSREVMDSLEVFINYVIEDRDDQQISEQEAAKLIELAGQAND